LSFFSDLYFYLFAFKLASPVIGSQAGFAGIGYEAIMSFI
jgi:hypothetical protein